MSYSIYFQNKEYEITKEQSDIIGKIKDKKYLQNQKRLANVTNWLKDCKDDEDFEEDEIVEMQQEKEQIEKYFENANKKIKDILGI